MWMLNKNSLNAKQADEVPSLVLVSRRQEFRERIGTVLESQGWRARFADSIASAAQELAEAPARVLMLDGWASITGAVATLQRILARQPSLAVVVSSSISLEDRQEQHEVERRVLAVYGDNNGGTGELEKLLSRIVENGGPRNGVAPALRKQQRSV